MSAKQLSVGVVRFNLWVCVGLLIGPLVALEACSSVSVDPSPTSTVSASTSTGGEATCPSLRADCDQDGTCETHLDTLESCGGCGALCSSTNATPSCNAGHCNLACNAGYADCNGDPSDGCEAQLSDDAAHCGQCGHACDNASSCLVSQCVDIIASAPAAFVGAESLVVQGSSLAWSTPGVDVVGEIASAPLAGGATTPLVNGGWPSHLHSNGMYYVWSDNLTQGVYRMPIAGGAVETLWQGSGAPVVIAMDASTVYFTTGTDVQSLVADGPAPASASLLASGFIDVTAAAVTSDSIYVTDWGAEVDLTQNNMSLPGHPDGTLSRVSLANHQVDTLATGLDTPSAVAVSNGVLVWAEAGSMVTYSDASNTDVNLGTLGRVVRANLDGSNATVIADQQIEPQAVLIDSAHIYWANAGTVGGADPSATAFVPDGSVMRAPLSGGAPETFMASIDARALAMTTDAVFFSSWNFGIIVRKAR